MRTLGSITAALLLSLSFLGALDALAQSSTGENQPPAAPSKARTENGKVPFTVGTSVSVSTLGFGADFAVPLTAHSNARIGFNVFNYDHTFDNDGVSYTGSLGLKSVHLLYDFFPLRGNFHLSPGVLLYNGLNLKANATVSSTSTFTLNNVDYRSSSTDPLTGTGKLTTNAVAPMFLIGYGNLVPRSHRHITYSIEGGIAYQGTPKTQLNFVGGSACDVNGANCQKVATDPQFQSNVQAQQTKIQNDVEPFKFYPIVSFGIGYKF